MSEFQFPYKVDLSSTKPFTVFQKKDYADYKCGDINVLDYLTKEEVGKANNVIVFSESGLKWYKGKEVITPKMVWETVNFLIVEHPERVIKSKNIYISTLPNPFWNFSDITSDYHKEKGQHYLEVILEEGAGEMDVLGLAAGITYLYGHKFVPHTISDKSGVYHLTVETQSDEQNDLLVPIFEVVQSHQKEIQKKKGLWVEFKTRRTEGKKSNEMPSPFQEDDWGW